MKAKLDTEDIVLGSGVKITVNAVSDFFEVSGEPWCIIEGEIKTQHSKRDHESCPVSIPCKAETVSKLLESLTPTGRLDKIKQEQETTPNDVQPDISPYMSRKEVSSFLGVSMATITNLVKRGQLTPVTEEGVRGSLFKREEVEKLKASGSIRGRNKKQQEEV